MGQTIDLEITWPADRFAAARHLEKSAQKELLVKIGGWGEAMLMPGIVYTKVSYGLAADWIRDAARRATGDDELDVTVEVTITHTWGSEQ